ncbi:MAG: hypothetical protein A3E88_07505 [Legionellales bacterium RIFCSPHIGHO2_12_FULL_35_11]|nr:MAG: hypothetical protein A3E88_07505 [Legionellales bacterium RIFCSPHIGHO2_12_FULL_35_11]
MIQYLLESTNYNLKNIADLSNSSIQNIRSIYFDDLMPSNFFSELQLVRLYHIILEVNVGKTSCTQCGAKTKATID